jgi:hypothetical protein
MQRLRDADTAADTLACEDAGFSANALRISVIGLCGNQEPCRGLLHRRYFRDAVAVRQKMLETILELLLAPCAADGLDGRHAEA